MTISFRSGQAVRVILNGVERSGEVVCPLLNDEIRVRIGGISRNVPGINVKPLAPLGSADFWAARHGVAP